jgi:hypothetical protein
LPSIVFAGALATLTLLCAGSASAGAGGGELGLGNDPLFVAFCKFLGMTSCPEVPTGTQAVLELAGLQTATPNYVRSPIIYGICSVSGNSFPNLFPSPTDTNLQSCSTIELDAVNAPVSSRVALSDLTKLTPLAFTTNKLGQAVPTQPGDPSANSFLYAVLTEVNGKPNALNLVYDNPLQTNFAAGQIVAKISLPLQVLSLTDGGERLVCCGVQGSHASVTVLQISSSVNGGLTAIVTGDFRGDGTQQSHRATELGLKFPLDAPAVLASTPNSRKPHAIFQVSVPLLVTGPTNAANCGIAITNKTPDPADCGNDPAYFGVTPGGATNGSAVGRLPASIRSPGSPPDSPTTFSDSRHGLSGSPSASPHPLRR